MRVSITAPSVTRSEPGPGPMRKLSRSRIRSHFTGSASLVMTCILLVTIATICILPQISALTFGPTYRIGSSSEKWTATCIASGSATEDTVMIGGYVTHTLNNTADFKVIKSDVKSGEVLWTQTIRPESGETKNMVLGCASDSSGDLYVATASTSSSFGDLPNSLADINTGTHGLFLSKLNGGDGTSIWTQSVGRANSGANDLLDIAWDPAANRVVLFGQMFIDGSSTDNEARLMRFDASHGVLSSSFVVISQDFAAVASGLGVDIQGNVYVSTASATAVNRVSNLCWDKDANNCRSCFVSKYGADNTHQWTTLLSEGFYCHEAVLAVDRVTNNLFTYVIIAWNNRDHAGLLMHFSATDGFLGPYAEIGYEFTWAGAVFAHNNQILVSGVTSDYLDIEAEVYFTYQSFIAQLSWDSQHWTLIDIQYLVRESNADAMESLNSGMAWSPFSSQVFVLTAQRYVTNRVFADAPTWLSIESPKYALPGNAHAGGPGDEQDSLLDSPIFWVGMGLLMSIGIGSTIALLYIRRRRRMRNGSPDKENQYQLDPKGVFKSTRGLLQSTGALAASPLNGDVYQSSHSLQIHSRKASLVPSTSGVPNSSIPLAYTLSTSSIAVDQVPPAPGKELTRPMPAVAGPNSKMNGTRASQTARSNFQDVSLDQETIAVSTTSTTSSSNQDATRWTKFSLSTSVDPPKMAPNPTLTESNQTGVLQPDINDVAKNTPGYTTTLACNQKAIAIPGFLEMQDGIDFTVDKELARGGGGTIYLGETSNPDILRISKSKQIVVKRVFENKDNIGKTVAAFDQEVAIMWLLNERNIAKIVGFCRKPMSILMKFYPHGSLDGLIHSQLKKPLLTSIVYNDDLALRLATDIACGVMIIHQEGLFHSDLKPPNVLLDVDEQGELYAVITDFGVAQVVKQSALLVKAFRVSTTAGASPCYAAPEILDNNTRASRSTVVQQAADTFSFAVILAELITRDVPWRLATRIEDVIEGVVAGQRAYHRPLKFGPCDHQARIAIMIEQCWHQSPRSRPQMEAVYRDLKAMLGDSQRQ